MSSDSRWKIRTPRLLLPSGLSGGEKVAMVRTKDGTVHAVQDTCTHGAVSLSEGEVEGYLG